MTYRAPINDMLLALNHGAGLEAAVKAGHYGDFDADITAAVLEEAGKFASDVLAPLNRVGDENGIKLEGGNVTTAPGWPDAYRRWTAAGWNAVSGPEAFGGQGLPLAINAACTEIWSASNLAFGLCPLLTLSAIEALDAHGSDELKNIYLEKLVSGEWPGTMQLTEPQAGSDVGALRTRAERVSDDSYRISGTKIFITYGDHDMSDNIVHFVLARLPDAPAGTKGISLFLIPKFLVNPDGSLGARNDIYASGIEHKLGMHAAPTCTMTMGDKGGATGYLIGEENRGMHCMFTMMNQARLAVGLEGVGIADRAYQQALAFAQERRQGRAIGKAGDGSDPIIVHPDIKRMLMQMRALTAAARTICYATAVALDMSVRATDPKARGLAAARGALLTPIAAGAPCLGAERCAGGRHTLSPAFWIGARRLHARRRSACRAQSRWRRGRCLASCHTGAIFRREHLGAGAIAGTHSDGQRRCRERRRRGSAGVERIVLVRDDNSANSRFEFQTAKNSQLKLSLRALAKQSMARHRKIEDGLLRRFAQP